MTEKLKLIDLKIYIKTDILLLSLMEELDMNMWLKMSKRSTLSLSSVRSPVTL